MFMQLEWTPDLSVGIEEIDSQHRELFRRINNLDSALRTGKAKAEIIRLIEFLDEYVVDHFGAEEKYMIDYNYAGYDRHKANHAWFINEFSGIREKFDAGEPPVTLIGLCNNLLITWFSNHIRTVDMALGGFLKSKARPSF
jgi:hemerythrin